MTSSQDRPTHTARVSGMPADPTPPAMAFTSKSGVLHFSMVAFTNDQAPQVRDELDCLIKALSDLRDDMIRDGY